MPRLHLFELEDYGWLPEFLRNYATDYLCAIQAWAGIQKIIAPRIRDTLSSLDSPRIVDLCSGGSGPVVSITHELAASGLTVPVLLTDKFPNVPAFERVQDNRGHDLKYDRRSIDAKQVPRDLVGLRTLFNALHHFRPEDARSVLRDAVEAQQPIASFEVSRRALPHLLGMLFVPLMVWAVTPFLRPFRWNRLLWTYLLPLVPLLCVWDGTVSQLRAYHPDELDDLVAGPEMSSFDWRSGETPGRLPITFLIGRPKE